MANEPDHLVLRRYVGARRRGDAAEADAAWEQLVINNFDRVQQIVKAFRFSPGGPGIPEHEIGSAVSEAYMRVIAMGSSFRETEIGQFYAALYTCVQNACRDYGRKELRHERRQAGSLDKRYDSESDAGPYDGALAAYHAELRRRSIEAVEDELMRQEAEGLVAWAISKVKNDKHREVLELTFIDKLDGPAIAEQLGITLQNVHARRSRGLKELERILREHGT